MNFHDPVRVKDTAGAGTATLTLSFGAWTGATVAPTTHSLTVLPPKPGPKAEPIAANLIASLVLPEHKMGVVGMSFSPDGKRLFTTGYPFDIVQIWDVASHKKARQIEIPPALRPSVNYALLSPDWKTLYVSVEKRTLTPIERDGKKQYRVDYSGEIRVWDVDSGSEKESLRPTKGSAPLIAKLSPDGRFLVYGKHASYTTPDAGPKEEMFVWDLGAKKTWKLGDQWGFPSFAPDGKTVMVEFHDRKTQASAVRILDLATGKELATVSCPEKERYFSVGAVSPDGAVVAVGLVGDKKGAPVEKWFFDARTLEGRGKLIGKGDPEQYGWGSGAFTPDGKKYVLLDEAGDLLVWNVAGQKVERTMRFGSDRIGSRVYIGPDGKTVAIAWMPKADEDLAETQDPDPQDLPQPRVSLIALDGSAPPRVLIAPHGIAGGLAFSPDSKTLAFGSSGAVHLFDLTK